MPDTIAALSEAMARDPSGMAWVELADALRRARDLRGAERTALRGLERHPHHAGGHDVLARIAADGGDLGRARDEWEMARHIDPHHVGAHLGLGWLALQGGDRETAARWWQVAREHAPDDARVVAVGRQLQHPPPAAPASTPRESLDLFASVEQAGASLALLVDDEGLVLAGRAGDSEGRDHGDELAAELSGLSGEAERALEQLQVGGWERMLVECETATFALAPAGGAIVVLATPAALPAGLPRLLLDRARRVALSWLEAL